MKFKNFLKENINRLLLIVIYILVMYVLPKLLNNIFGQFINTNEQALLYSCLLNVSLYLLLIISSVILLRNDLKQDFKVLKNVPAITTFIIIIVGIIAAYAMNYIGSIITSILSGNGGTSANESSIREMINSKYGIIFIPTVAFIGPIVEELVFRKALTNVLRSLKINDWLVVIIVALLFGSIHVIDAGDFVQVFPYIAMGLALGGIEKISKNIFPSTCVHIFNNYIAVVMQIILGYL